MHIVKLDLSFTNATLKRSVYLCCLRNTIQCGNDYCIYAPLSNGTLHLFETGCC